VNLLVPILPAISNIFDSGRFISLHEELINTTLSTPELTANALQPFLLNIMDILSLNFASLATHGEDTNRFILKQTNIIVNSLNTTHNKSTSMLLHDFKNIMTTEFGFLKSNIDGALINHDAFLRQYTKRMILQMGAETNLIFKDLLAAADRNTIQNRDVMFKVYQRLTNESNETKTSTDSLRIISTTWEDTFCREIHSSENRLIRILGVNKDEQTSSILAQSNNEYKALSHQINDMQKSLNLQIKESVKKAPESKQTLTRIEENLFHTKAIKESTDFMKQDLEFIISNEEEIKDLNDGILSKFETVLTKEDEILVNQVELYHSTEIVKDDLKFIKENEEKILVNQLESTEFVKEDLDFVKRNEEEIKNLELGVLSKFDIVPFD
jgi:hypothetical protein